MSSKISFKVTEMSFILPVYNEEKSISDTLNRLYKVLLDLKISFEIIVVNDGSKDSTIEKIEAFDNEITVVNHPINIGYGNAIKVGIKSAKFMWIGIVDADGTYKIEELSTLVKKAEKGFDMVVASRFNSSKIDSILKRIFRWIFNSIIKIFINLRIEDPNSGFRIFKKEIMLDLLPHLCGRFSFTTSATILLIGLDYFVCFVPVSYAKRVGPSKVHPFTDSIGSLQTIMQGITFFNPIKFFILFSILYVIIFCIPAMILAMYAMFTLSLYYMIFGSTVSILIGFGILADTIRISMRNFVVNKK